MPSYNINGIELCHYQPDFPLPKRKKTNYERIKDMGLDELSKLLAYSECRICAFNNNKKCSSDKGVGQCHKGIRLWLESESE